MEKYFCSYCDTQFNLETFYSVRDKDRLLYLHEECVPMVSGGVKLAEIRRKCNVTIENNVKVNISCTIWSKGMSSQQSHRSGDLPAKEWTKGDKEWWVDGNLHRIDKPTCEYDFGVRRRWHVNGQPHREDGPAIDEPARKEWWLDGKRYAEPEWENEMVKRNSQVMISTDVEFAIGEIRL